MLEFGIMSLDFVETTKSTYYKLREDKKRARRIKPYGFLYKTEEGDWLAYITRDGKFYVAEMGEYTEQDWFHSKLDTMETRTTAVFRSTYLGKDSERMGREPEVGRVS